MTPPDSGERCPWSGYTDNNLSGQCSLRRGHGGPHEIAQPDSGERCNEVLGEDRVVYQCSRPKGHVGHHRDGNVTAWDQKPDSGEREVCKHGGPGGDCAVCVAEREYRIFISRSLAQRVLAALEGHAAARDCDGWLCEPLAAELRKVLPK